MWRRVVTLAELYACCPPVPCEKGCSACCGPVPFSRSEWARTGLPESVAKQTPALPGALLAGKGDSVETLVCLFREDGGCSIYADRPFICRLYGCGPGLACAKGRSPKLPLSETTMALLAGMYQQIVKEEAK